MLIDARSVAAGSEVRCDLCVVGAGPAGISIVDRLRESGLSIILLEAAGSIPMSQRNGCFAEKTRAARYYRLDACRYRLFGGSTNRWGGWCRPLEPADFEQRDWLPWSGWPIDETALEPYHGDAAKLFELADACFDLPAWGDRLPTPFALDGTAFESVVFRYSGFTQWTTCTSREVRCSRPGGTLIRPSRLSRLRSD